MPDGAPFIQHEAGKLRLAEDISEFRKLKSLRHLSFSCTLPFLRDHKQGSLPAVNSISLDCLAGLANLVFLNLSPDGRSAPFVQSPSNARMLEVWQVLEVLKHLPLQELYVGVLAPQPPCPHGPEAHAFYQAVGKALRGSSDRLSMAMLRGTRGWPSQEVARKLLCPAREK